MVLHVVLFRPLIPSNTGNIGRTCLGFGARLHLIRPLGFELNEKEVKRAGLDHWDQVDLAVHESWQAFADSTLKDTLTTAYLISKRLKLGSTPIAEVNFPPSTGPLARGVALVFGNEVDGLTGLDEDARKSLPALYLPMRDDAIRSYNLSNAVAMALYEVDRQRTVAAATGAATTEC